MNYYKHHLGDYLRDTAHLSLLEDGAYRRLLDLYYLDEVPLPKALKDVCRRVRVTSKSERQAVESVLREFFEETEEGWRHRRCDAEIAEYLEGEPDREAKKENQRERQRRTRERRAMLFAELKAHGVVPPYDARMRDLEDTLSRVTKRDGHADVTVSDTATHTPSPTSHSQFPSPSPKYLLSPSPPGTHKFSSPNPAREDVVCETEGVNVESLARIRTSYPPGGREDWKTAETSCCRLVATNQATWADLEAVTARYRAVCRASNRKVMNPAQFFAEDNDRPWSQRWALPEEPESAMERILRVNGFPPRDVYDSPPIDGSVAYLDGDLEA